LASFHRRSSHYFQNSHLGQPWIFHIFFEAQSQNIDSSVLLKADHNP